jgi:uncharacterized membrane protein
MKNLKLVLILVIVFITTQTFAQSSGGTYGNSYSQRSYCYPKSNYSQSTYSKPTYNFSKDTSRFYGTDTFMIYKKGKYETYGNGAFGGYGDAFGINVSTCSQTTYLGTMRKSVKFTSLETKNNTSYYNDQNSISLFDLLADAMAKYGNEVFIQNLRWDMKNKKRISVVYDVIKCQQSKIKMGLIKFNTN